MMKKVLTIIKEETNVKKLLSLLVAIMLIASVSIAMADTIEMDKLTLEFVPSKDADVIITGTANLPELLQAEMLNQGYDIGEVDITVGTSYEATGEAMAAGSIDIGWLPAAPMPCSAMKWMLFSPPPARV